jgi:chemotaxis protein MotA
MSLTTLFGFLAGVGLFIGAIMSATDNYFAFVNGPAIIMVLGGTLAATFIGYQGRYVFLALRDIGNLFIKGKVDRRMLTIETGKIIRWGYLVKKSGLLALEREIKSAKKQDNFLNYGIELVITGYSGEEVRQMLSAAANGAFQRAMVQAIILKNMAAAAPAFGMIGTLVGLIIMLESLASDPEALGPGLAVALITTLYGVLLARLVFLPSASKVEQKEGILRFRNFLVTEGFAMLAEHKSPRYIQDRMNSFLDPSIHYTIDKNAARGGGGGGGGRQRRRPAEAA